MYQVFGSVLQGGAGAAAIPAGSGRIEATTRFGRGPARPAFDWTPDLGAAIGSATWWRGLVTCAGLCALAWTLGPSFEPMPSLERPALDDVAWEHARAQAIAPIALGADTGRRIAATDAVQPLVDAPERPRLELTVKIGQGDGLRHALERAGVGAGEAQRIVRLAATIADPDRIAPGTALALTLGRRPDRNSARPVEALAFRASFTAQLAFARVAGALVMRHQPIAVEQAPLRISGLVGEGVYVSASAAGAPAAAIQTYIRALAPTTEFGSLPPDARYELIVERERAATGDVRFGKLLYVGLTHGGRQTRMIEWTVGGRTGWYDPEGVGQARPGFATPVQGARKTSGFGWRLHPLLGYSRFHQGVDYGAPTGTPIRAATDGVVAFAGWHGGHGKMVKLQHGGGLGTGYAHMSRIAVAPGDRVAQGDVIGYVGSTGLSTGPHLHFEVYRAGRAVNPSDVTFASTSLLSGSELTAFRERFRRITASGG